MGRMRSQISDSPLDRISGVPDDVMSNILAHLPTRDVMRTSVLSKMWRHKWKLAPNIILNHSLISENYQLSGIATYILCHHRGPIEKFALRVNKVGSYCEIDLWLYFLSQKGTQDVHLRIVEGERHKMPSYLFSCQKLRTLELCNFLLKPPPTFQGFPNLVWLGLSGVEVEQSVLESIIATSPLLKKLTLKDMGAVKSLKIGAPNLTTFFFEGILEHVCFLTPVLSELSIKLDGDEGLKITEFPPALDVLVLDSKFWKFLDLKSTLQARPTALKHLTYLYIGEICFKDVDEMSFLMTLFGCSPNLQRLNMRACTNIYFDFEPITTFWQAQNNSDLSLGQLSRVTIHDFPGESPELKFVQFILAKSPLLETIAIFPVNGFRYDDQVVTREIMRFSRASSMAEIIYFPPADPDHFPQ